MKSLHIILFLALILTPALSFSAGLQRIPATSQITAVTVYADRALTTRSSTLTLKQGSYLIAFESLPTMMMDDSVRVNGKGTSTTTVTGLEIKRQFLAESGE
ncbi:MAG TPA: DUF4140 domain-containing protein, partial [Desulfuromonadales bacterium]|nr:DUF4140 domain-containing protein [Desulfuromonadales bacterium]